MPDFPPQYDMHQSLGFLINRTGRRLGHALRTVFQENGFDITPAQWGVLCFLANRDGVNQQELAEISSRDKTTLARVIKGMEKRGLIARVPDKADRRQNHLFLTREGAKLRDALVPLVKAIQEQYEKGFDPQHLTIFKEGLNRVFENLAHLEKLDS
ncbi:MAG TPA: MarR family transcriptional regulator [Calditrichia bacterium]|nr:MarR family transcriptional regulator [Calditrichia bacterium]